MATDSARPALLAAGLLAAALALRGQTVMAPIPVPAPADSSPWSVHAQSTYLVQWHYGFPSPYEGPNSFKSAPDREATYSASLYLGRALWSGAALYFNPEIFQGHGLSGSVGMGAFPNGEAIKSGFPQLHYNTSRLYLQQVVGLGGSQEKLDDDELQVAGEVDVDRLVFTAGLVSPGDFFDGNAYSHDSRRQFLNWALMDSASWDAPSNVEGFTGGAVAEWNTERGELHYGLFMEPRETNSEHLDHHLGRALGQILQYDLRYKAGGLEGTLRPFAYLNRAYSGLFSAADAEAAPDIATTRAYRWKEGLGLSWDQALSAQLGVFARLSWNDGQTEDIAFTDVDRSVAAGLSAQGAGWGRPGDTAGLAFVADGLAPGHRRYLEQGGVGFVVGDGALDYGTEEAVECYYRIGLGGHLSLSPDWQYLEHPGYNRDRGGFSVYAVRAHLEF